MSLFYSEEEERISNAISALERRDNPNVKATAREFECNYQKLRRRWNGIPSKIDYGGHNKRLSDEQEIMLCNWLTRLDKLGISARPAMLTSSVAIHSIPSTRPLHGMEMEISQQIPCGMDPFGGKWSGWTMEWTSGSYLHPGAFLFRP